MHRACGMESERLSGRRVWVTAVSYTHLDVYKRQGHALVSALQKDSEPVQKITIVPRTMGALGYVMQVPEEEKYLNTEKEIRAMLVGFLGGRAAEEIVFDTVTTGASNDIEKATRIARAMVTQYGMSKKFGPVSYTHLDVYKRQRFLPRMKRRACRPDTGRAVTPALFFCAVDLTISRTAMAVFVGVGGWFRELDRRAGT